VTGAGDEEDDPVEEPVLAEEPEPASGTLDTAGVVAAGNEEPAAAFRCAAVEVAAVERPANPGSLPDASWMKIAPQTATKIATAPATTRLRSSCLRPRTRARTSWAEGRAPREGAGAGAGELLGAVSVSCMAPVLSTAHQRDLSHSEGLRKKPIDPPAP
jgi:hypothetical protein